MNHQFNRELLTNLHRALDIRIKEKPERGHDGPKHVTAKCLWRLSCEDFFSRATVRTTENAEETIVTTKKKFSLSD